MIDPETLDAYVELFQGCDTHYGTNEGGCVEARHDWDEIAEWHLTGEIEPIGVYPIFSSEMAAIYKPNWPVCWGCVDFDEGYVESLVHAKNLVAVLAQFHIRGWIERSRSKGYHVWIFSREVASARVVRRALLAACQIVGAPTKEINPKQEQLGPGQLGNYVRLPYPGAFGDGEGYEQVYRHKRQAFLNQYDIIDPSWFVEYAYADRCEVVDLESLADLYTPPNLHLLVPKRDFTNIEGDIYERMSGLARRIFEEGPHTDQPVTDAKGVNNGRSTRLWKLACVLRDDARHSVDEVVMLVGQADARWGKFHLRPGGDSEITRLVHKVYGMT